MTADRHLHLHPTVAVLASLLAVLGVEGCADSDPAPGPVQSPRDAATDGAGDRGPAAPRCRPGPGASGTPATIDEAVRLVNSLPRPVTVTCFLESLDRPLRAVATNNTISLQPAAGSRSPRIFLLTDALVMSLVIDGKARDLLEFGQYVTGNRTLKGEIAFPATAEVTPGEPYRRIRSNGPTSGSTGTSCRFCHAGEEPGPELGGAVAYISSALKPSARSVVPLDDIRREHQACDRAAEPDRCQFLGALLDHGEVVETTFPSEVPTFFD
jgi:hypothetical protein